MKKKHKKIGVHGIHNAGPVLPGINGTQYSAFSREDFTLSISSPNNCCGLKDGLIVIVENIVSNAANDLFIIGRQCINLSDLYTKPCNSSLLGIYKSTECGNLSAWPLDFLKIKYVKCNISDTLVLLPLLHNVCIYFLFCLYVYCIHFIHCIFQM